ncbi:MAG TPA: hypothetical protein VN622_08330 [Clostridia bacterium]|nr:hypothetical protein [Clostridia bacterium]
MNVLLGEEPATPPLPPSTPDNLQPPSEPLRPTESPLTLPADILPGRLNWGQALRTALLVGIIAGLITIVRSPLLLGLWLLAAGGISVAFYRARMAHHPITPGIGFRLGAVTGLVAFAVKAIVSSIGVLVPASRAEIVRQVQEQVAAAIANNPDPAAQEMMRNIGEWLNTPGGFATMFTIGLLFLCLFSTVLAGVGGALGALFGRKDHEP